MEKLKKLPYYGSVALLAYMPFHIFLSQWLSTLTGGLDAWKVAKDVVAMALVLISFGMVIWTRAYRKTPYLMFVGLLLAYLFLHISLYFINSDTTFGIAALATVYNNRLLWFLIIGLSVALITPELIEWKRLRRIVLITSTLTCLFGLIQYTLPKDLMTNFGYSVERGVKPAFFIDDKPDLPRVMSTLRDPNSFGAFLIIPILLIWQQLLRSRNKDQRMLYLGLFGLHGLNLFLTFSRAAWAGAFLSLAILSWIEYRHVIKKAWHRFWPALTALVLTLLIGGFLLRDQYFIQNVIFHSDETTKAELDSNDLHLDFAQKGVAGIADQPLGHGPGTAGIVSIQNKKGGLLTENYFIQIGYEAGVAGLAVFIFLLILAYRKLNHRTTILQPILLAAFWGFLLISMVTHLWTNETIAAYWWLLAGLVIGSKQTAAIKR